MLIRYTTTLEEGYGQDQFSSFKESLDSFAYVMY